MTYTKKIALITATFLLASSAFAATWATTTSTTSSTGTAATTTAKPSIDLVITWAPKLVNKTSSTVVLEWNKVTGAGSYIVKFGKKSVANSTEANPQYEDESDPVTATWTTIEKLDPNTEYFFSVVVLDKENSESNVLSDELKVKTDAAGATTGTGAATPTSATTGTGAATTTAATSLALTNVVPQDTKTISLEFSSALSKTEPVSVKIRKISDSSDVAVNSVKADPTSPNKVTVSLWATPLDPKSSYSVISAKDAAGANIEQGVNGVKEFEAPATLAPAADSMLNSATGTWASASGSLAAGSGSTISASGSLAANGQLPATGTKENLIVIAALLISFGIVYGYRKRTAK